MTIDSRLSASAYAVCERAKTEALQLGYNFIQSEHLLLALTRQEDSVAVRALAELDIEPKTLRKAVLKVLLTDLRQDQKR